MSRGIKPRNDMDAPEEADIYLEQTDEDLLVPDTYEQASFWIMREILNGNKSYMILQQVEYMCRMAGMPSCCDEEDVDDMTIAFMLSASCEKGNDGILDEQLEYSSNEGSLYDN